MSTKLGIFVTAHYSLLVHCFVVVLGCIAVGWGLFVFPIFWDESSIERIANQIIAGDQFKMSILARQFPIMASIERSAYCRPSAVRSAAIIQLHMVEGAAPANNRERFDGRLKSFSHAIRSSLSCAPSDPFLWLVLYWLEGTQDGFRSEDLKYLRMSYRLGPNEAWIALKRNHVAFARLPQLPPDLAENAINEFTTLLESKFIDQAVEIFIGLAWPERNLILSRLVGVADQDRRLFADALYNRGYDVNVPGVASRDSSPWHRP